MLKYVFKRILYMIFVFLVMSILLFVLYNGIQGDPARAEIEPMKTKLEPAQYEQLYRETRARMGLDDPLVTRYTRWLSNTLRLDFGQSHRYQRPVIDVVIPPLKFTIKINIFAVIIGLAITIPLGIFTAVKKNSLFDKSVQVLTIIGYSIPVFITALLFMYFFAVRWRLLPLNGMETPNFKGTAAELRADQIRHLILPLIVMTVTSLASITRYVRAAMMEALSMDYIKTARAKGLKEKAVIFSHAWRNALLPVITLIIGWIMSIFSGAFIIESMFNLNGMGKLYIDSLYAKDLNVVLAVQLFYVLIALIGNLLVDLSYGIVDPRVRVNE